MRDHLKSIYVDPNELIRVKATFRGLFQKDKKYTEFLSDFVYWVVEAKIQTGESHKRLHCFRLYQIID